MPLPSVRGPLQIVQGLHRISFSLSDHLLSRTTVQSRLQIWSLTKTALPLMLTSLNTHLCYSIASPVAYAAKLNQTKTLLDFSTLIICDPIPTPLSKFSPSLMHTCITVYLNAHTYTFRLKLYWDSTL